MQPHGVVVVNEALDKSSGILLGKRAAKPEAISFEALVPAFDFPVALWVIGGGFDMGQPGQADKLLKVFSNKLRTVIGDDSRRSIRIFFPSSLQNNLDIKLRHCGAQFPMQQELVMKADNGYLFPRLQPMIARNQSVVLVGFAVTITPGVKLAPAQTDPGHKLQGADLGAFRPVSDENHDRVANIVCHPTGRQVSPSSFFKRVCSSSNSESTSFLRWSFCSRASIFF